MDPKVHGPPLWTRFMDLFMDPVYGLPLWTTPHFVNSIRFISRKIFRRKREVILALTWSKEQEPMTRSEHLPYSRLSTPKLFKYWKLIGMGWQKTSKHLWCHFWWRHNASLRQKQSTLSHNLGKCQKTHEKVVMGIATFNLIGLFRTKHIICSNYNPSIATLARTVYQSLRKMNVWTLLLSLPPKVARVWFPDSASYVSWVCWFSTVLREVFLRLLRFSPLPSPQKPIFDLIWVNFVRVPN